VVVCTMQVRFYFLIHLFFATEIFRCAVLLTRWWDTRIVFLFL